MRVCSLVLVAACLVGACRFGFDELAHPDATSGTLSDAPGASDDVGGIAVPAITFGERPTSERTGVTTDATLQESNPLANWGGAESVALSAFSGDREHAVLRFDLSSLAPGTPVIGARLALAKIDYGDENPGPLELRVVGESWVEGTSQGVPGAGASWSSRSSTMTWTSPGGTTTGTVTTVNPESTEFVVLLPPELVKTWIDDPSTNHGLVLALGATGAHVHVHARNSNVDGGIHRPELAIIVAQ